MDQIQILLLLMAVAIILVGFAVKLRVPYPLALIFGGSIFGFIPGLDETHFDPYTVLFIVLPPTLYYAAYSIPYKEFYRYLQDILWLALGLVLITTLSIGLIFKGLFPELPWALAFAFGAIVSPPDALAATTIMRRFDLSTRLMVITEGESLINDATGLVLYRLAVVALLSGTFSFVDANTEFAFSVVGGIIVGAIVGYLLHLLSNHFFDPVLAVIFSFIIPYITFSIADDLHVSGVLAVVVCGLIGARLLVTHFSALTRVVGWSAWDIISILLNCFVYILIGLQLKGLIQRLTLEKTLLYTLYGLFITFAMIIIRFLWIYLRVFIVNKMGRHHARHKRHTFHEALILSWSGMRGIVSLTAALALPFYLLNGQPLPGRDVIIFLTFVVIFFTLLIPGLTLPTLINWLNVRSMEKDHINTPKIRQELIKAAKTELQHLNEIQMINESEYDFLLNYFNTRHQMLEIAFKGDEGSSLEEARRRVLRKKRECLLAMWEKNEINDHLLNTLEREIDLEEAYSARAII